MAIIKAYKAKLVEPVQWVPLAGNRAVLAGITAEKPVQTVNGQMIPVKLKTHQNFIQNVDVAAFLATAKYDLRPGVPSPSPPELWFWNGVFWTKAYTLGWGGIWYQKQNYLFYQIEVADAEDLLAGAVMPTEE